MASQILSNAKWEKFAQLVASGEKSTVAYISVGYKCNNESALSANASRLLNKDSVTDRIYHLRVTADEKALKQLGVSRAKVLKMLMENATSAPEAAARNRALELVGKEHAMFVDRSQSQVTVKSLSDLPDEDLAAIVAQAEEAEKRRETVQ